VAFVFLAGGGNRGHTFSHPTNPPSLNLVTPIFQAPHPALQTLQARLNIPDKNE
jgi:hypothetical protein